VSKRDMDKSADTIAAVLAEAIVDVRSEPRPERKVPLTDDEALNEGWALTIKSATAAAYQRYDRSDGNPVYVWQVISMCLDANAPSPHLPDWCLDYLWQVSSKILQLSSGLDFRTGEEAKDPIALVPLALGLSGPGGKSAFKKHQSDMSKIGRKMQYDKLRNDGVRQVDALQQIGRARGRIVEEAEATKKAVAGGKKLLMHIPAPPAKRRTRGGKN
jgi:hypothetical protein